MQPAPVIPWLGGKRRLADKLIPLFPQHECYVEVFCGGAALYFLKRPSRVEVLNDINNDLVILYRVLTHHLEEFVRQFKWAFSSRQIFEWLDMTRPETLTDIQRAARFYYLQHHAFGGKVDGQNYGTATTAPMPNIMRIEESLSAAWMRLSQGTNVENLPWLDCMKRYDRGHTFFYCDPPYWETAGYGVPFQYDNYERMAEFMKSCQGKVMVSLNDHPEIRRAFDGLTIIGGDLLGIKYSVGNTHGEQTTSKELVILNYDPLNAGGLF